MYRRLLVPLDGSLLAEQALPHARAIAERFQASLTLARAVVPVPYVVPDPTLTMDDAAPLVSDAWATARDAAAAYLAEVRQRLPAASPVETQVLDGPPSESVLRYAVNAAIDLIVMTTHGHSGLAHLVYGSVAEQILHRAPMPLLLIRVRP